MDFVSCISTPEVYTPYFKKKTVKILCSNLRILYMYYISICNISSTEVNCLLNVDVRISLRSPHLSPLPMKPCTWNSIFKYTRTKTKVKTEESISRPIRSLLFHVNVCAMKILESSAVNVQSPKYSSNSWVPTSFLECLHWFRALHIETRVPS